MGRTRLKIALLAIVGWLAVGFQRPQAQPAPPSPKIIVTEKIVLETLTPLPKILKEASGLEITKSRWLWTHNDDKSPILYALDTLGDVVRVIHLNHTNRGWEDLTLDKDGNLYIGAFGNNKNDRTDLSIIKISDPENITDRVFNGELIEFDYPDQSAFPPPPQQRNFDSDAFISMGDSLYIFSKNRTEPFSGFTKVYRLPSTPGRYKAILTDSIYLGNGPMMDDWVTSADLSPDGKCLALLSHDSIWLITGFENKRFSEGRISRISLGNFSHKAGLCFSSSTHIYIVDELEFGFLGGNIYSLDLASILMEPSTNRTGY